MVGNITNFTDIDVLRCFLSIGGNTSRLELVKRLELGEGTVRTILDILKNEGFIVSTQKGHSLSEKGIKTLENIKEGIKVLHNINYEEYKGLKGKGIVVKNAKIQNTTQLRDTAIKNRAEAALVLAFDKKLKMPGFQCKEDFSELEKFYDFKSKDVLIATFASSQKLAEQSALLVAAELNDDLKKFIKIINKK
ncbi:hypothetical protein ISS05_02245 [Candidatus Woesearchaeota archaeon]|nr:hypothetical protein [Candidatus Woesearchaeota archaeon]